MVLKETTVNKKALSAIYKNIKKHSPHPKKVKIIAVTKGFSWSTIQSAICNNLFFIGENKTQETKKKLENKTDKIKIHMIGHLQSNKAKEAVLLYDTIQTVDSYKIANKINKEAKKINIKQKILIQINISNNKNQHGINIKEATPLAMEIQKMKNINLIGLMAIGPQTKDKKKIGERYKELYEKQQWLQKNISKKIKELSIGMSEDYTQALKNSATIIRIGRGLFGSRLK